MGALPEVALEAGTVIVGDLHVDVEDPAGVARFLELLRRARAAPRLVVLGDLFEYWLGAAHQRTAGGERVVRALAERAAGGRAFDVVPGNRDFLLDEGFERAARARVLRHGLVGLLPGGARIVCVHGDELATRDVGYQRLRAVLRSGPVVALAPRLPLAVSRGLARRLRRASARAVERKPSAEKELQRDAAFALCARHGADLCVCGHAHAFRDEREGSRRWIVLDAYGGARDALVVEEGGVSVRASAALG